MESQPTGRRYRPILRLNDLLHPIQQRERMLQFATPEEPIGPYVKYSRVWAPTQMSALFVIKVPRSLTRLSEDAYVPLLKQRLHWLLQTWTRNGEGAIAATQELLEASLRRELDPLLDVPVLDEDIDGNPNERLSPSAQWREEWADVLTGSDRFLDMLALQGIKFPVHTFDASHPDYPDLLTLHQETDLATWLSLLMA